MVGKIAAQPSPISINPMYKILPLPIATVQIPIRSMLSLSNSNLGLDSQKVTNPEIILPNVMLAKNKDRIKLALAAVTDFTSTK